MTTTDPLLEAIAAAIRAHGVDEYIGTNPITGARCICGFVLTVGPDGNNIWDAHRAEQILAAVAESGRLLPDGAEVQYRYYHRIEARNDEDYCPSQTFEADVARAHECWRRVQIWPNGERHYGPLRDGAEAKARP